MWQTIARGWIILSAIHDGLHCCQIFSSGSGFQRLFLYEKRSRIAHPRHLADRDVHHWGYCLKLRHRAFLAACHLYMVVGRCCEHNRFAWRGRSVCLCESRSRFMWLCIRVDSWCWFVVQDFVRCFRYRCVFLSRPILFPWRNKQVKSTRKSPWVW